MSKSRGLSVLLAVVISPFLTSNSSLGQTLNCLDSTASENQAAQHELDEGIEAYRNATYAEAISHFQKATDLAPCMIAARRYLATAQAQNVVPALSTPDNLKTAQQAIANFQLVLAQDLHDINSLKQVAGIYFNTNRLDQAREWQKKVLTEDSHAPEAAYTIGVIDWTKAHVNALNALKTIGLMDDGEGNSQAPPEILSAIRAQNSALIAEAMQYLTQAIADRPNYADAMAYLNLVYRRKADTDYDNPALRVEDVATAKEWNRRSMAARQENDKGANTDSSQPQ